MLKKNPKTRCERRTMDKVEGVCRLYNKTQIAYAERLEQNDDVIEILCNVPFESTKEPLSGYTSDFVCKKTDGTYMVRECVERKKLTWPSVVSLLDASWDYWKKRGVEDWGIVLSGFL